MYKSFVLRMMTSRQYCLTRLFFTITAEYQWCFETLAFNELCKTLKQKMENLKTSKRKTLKFEMYVLLLHMTREVRLHRERLSNCCHPEERFHLQRCGRIVCEVG